MREGKGNGNYRVTIYDCAGEYANVKVSSFTEVLDWLRENAKNYPIRNYTIQVSNEDYCDYDTNGLTDDEKDALCEVL